MMTIDRKCSMGTDWLDLSNFLQRGHINANLVCGIVRCLWQSAEHMKNDDVGVLL